eukprot:2037337-Rhodomonas_salina.2
MDQSCTSSTSTSSNKLRNTPDAAGLGWCCAEMCCSLPRSLPRSLGASCAPAAAARGACSLLASASGTRGERSTRGECGEAPGCSTEKKDTAAYRSLSLPLPPALVLGDAGGSNAALVVGPMPFALWDTLCQNRTWRTRVCASEPALRPGCLNRRPS